MTEIRDWFAETGLEIATEKAEDIFLRGNKAGRIKELGILGTTIEVGKRLKYLGVVLDSMRSFRPHLESGA